MLTELNNTSRTLTVTVQGSDGHVYYIPPKARTQLPPDVTIDNASVLPSSLRVTVREDS